MGALCSRSSTLEDSPDSQADEMNGYQHQVHPTRAVASKSPLYKVLPKAPPSWTNKTLEEREESDMSFSFETEDLLKTGNGDCYGFKKKISRVLSERTRTARSRTTQVARKGAAKVNEVGSLLGRVGSVAVGALDTLGSSMTVLNLGSGFASGVAPKGNKIGILAFEVANTIVKGFNLKQSLLEENIRILKEETLQSEGVQRLVSADMTELLRIAASDKRNELKICAVEVVRFGNHCRNPQWHHLDRFFEKLGREMTILSQTKEEAEAEMQNLMTLAQYTAELYHELHALDRFETDYQRMFQEEELLNNSQSGNGLLMLKNELKSQKRHVKNLKKRSLWSKILEEVVEKLVDMVFWLHQEIQNAFDDAGGHEFRKNEIARDNTAQKLGDAGLSLHYANIINQIDSLVSRPSSVPSNTRDSLYQGLPPSVKASLRIRLQHPSFQEELTASQIKEEMENTLYWLVPVAANTAKVHHGFGWVGEWANTGSTLDQRLQSGRTELMLLQTLHHADQRITEVYILELIVRLHHLVSLASSNVIGNKSPIKSPTHSPNQKGKLLPITENPVSTQTYQKVHVTPELSVEDQQMLKEVKYRKFTPGLSKSQEFDSSKATKQSSRLSKSFSHSPSRSSDCNFSLLSRQNIPLADSINFEIDRLKVLDIIDRVDSI